MQINRNRRRLNETSLPPVTVEPQTAAPASLPPNVVHNRSRRRSQEILDAVARLDTCTDDQTRREILDWVGGLYEQREGGTLLGLFGRCYLGTPYVDHLMDITGGIVTHYTPDDLLPPAFGPARPLARSSAYLFVEVYSDGQVVPVRSDGSSAV